MAQHERQEIAFLDETGNPLRSDELDAEAADDLAGRRRARVEQWLPDGGGAALSALVFVLVAWLGATPLVQAVAALAPVGMHRIGSLTEDSINNFGGGDYFGVTPGLLPVLIHGTRAFVLLIAFVLAFRARARERSALATAAVATSSISLVLVLAAGVALTVGLAMGHGGGGYTYPS